MEGEKVVAFVRACEHTPSIMKTASHLDFEEIGDGNMNFVFRVKLPSPPPSPADVSSVIVKYAPPYIKILGPEYALTSSRLQVEADALDVFYKLDAGACPKPFHFDAKENFLMMQDLEGYVIYRTQLLDGSFSPGAAGRAGLFMATVVNGTSTSPESLLKKFDNPTMAGITRDYFFVKPLDAEDTTNSFSEALAPAIAEIREDPEIQEQFKDLQTRFCSAKECLSHGDLHTGSIMVKGEDMAVIDGEFAFVGPTSFDIGVFLGHMIFALVASRTKGKEEFNKVLAEIRDVWKSFVEHIAVSEDKKQAIMSEAVGFGCVDILRRIIGPAKVQDVNGKEESEKLCLKVGSTILKQHALMKSLEAFEKKLLAVCPSP
eukprot:m.179915 g.179915  ORF g.179915 m.179915 type:complete len:374 (+) comp25402_c0_seq2:125-1246(+)